MAESSLVREATALLDELEARPRAAPSPAQQRRESPRHRYRRELALTRRDEGGSTIQTWAMSRDLSAGGLACVHPEPLTLGTPLKVRLPLADGKWQEIGAQVTRREELAEGWYLLGLMFDEMIDPLKYLVAHEE